MPKEFLVMGHCVFPLEDVFLRSMYLIIIMSRDKLKKNKFEGYISQI